MKKPILNFTIGTISFLFLHVTIHAQRNPDTIYYFIDTDIKLSPATVDGTEGIYVSSPIRTALWQDRETLIATFKKKLRQEYPNQQNNMDSRVVLRWQTSMSEIQESYVLKEFKMKKQKYSLVKID